MDPVTVIAAAVVAGAAAGMNEVMNTAARDAYATLRGLLRRRFGADEQTQAALDAPVPEAEDAPADHIRPHGIGDEELRTVERPTQPLSPTTGSASKYSVTITDSKIINIGDHTYQVNYPPHGVRSAPEATPTPE
ncbi:hypothetical protein ACQPZP_24960 [Spirillospora sp. CA-142024]|uniref:hypothetical protein n=1 Tax=Spirillospora sp. CA-142024 TaxID=3240036 RepID=UPI003D8E835D